MVTGVCMLPVVTGVLPVVTGVCVTCGDRRVLPVVTGVLPVVTGVYYLW